MPSTSPNRTSQVVETFRPIRDAAGKKNLYYLFQTDMKSPETVQATFDVQRQIGRLASVSAGYVHTSGENLPILLNFANAYDRVTGVRPNPAITPGGWYVTSGQTMTYNAFEGNANLRRFHGLERAHHALFPVEQRQQRRARIPYILQSVELTLDFRKLAFQPHVFQRYYAQVRKVGRRRWLGGDRGQQFSLLST